MQPIILHIVHSVSPGGTERVLASLTGELARRGQRHVVCALRRLGRMTELFDPSVEVITLGEQGNNRLLFRTLARRIREIQPTVIHARNWGTWTDAVLASRLAPGAQLLLGFQGLQEGDRFNSMQRVRALALGMRRLPAATVSNASRDVLVADLGFSPDAVTVIPNGVNLQRFRPGIESQKAAARQSFDLSAGDFVIVSTGAFKPVKRLEVLIAAMARLIKSHPAARLLLAGYGRDEPELRQQVEQLGLTNHVRVTGWLPDVRDVLHAADAYACTSRYEGMSNSVLEALATGLCCVVTDVSDHRRMFAGFDPSAVVAVDDVAAITNRLGTLASSKQQRQAIGQSTRNYIERNHNFANTIDKYERLYNSLSNEPWASACAVLQDATKEQSPTRALIESATDRTA